MTIKVLRIALLALLIVVFMHFTLGGWVLPRSVFKNSNHTLSAPNIKEATEKLYTEEMKREDYAGVPQPLTKIEVAKYCYEVSKLLGWDQDNSSSPDIDAKIDEVMSNPDIIKEIHGQTNASSYVWHPILRNSTTSVNTQYRLDESAGVDKSVLGEEYVNIEVSTLYPVYYGEDSKQLEYNGQLVYGYYPEDDKNSGVFIIIDDNKFATPDETLLILFRCFHEVCKLTDEETSFDIDLANLDAIMKSDDVGKNGKKGYERFKDTIAQRVYMTRERLCNVYPDGADVFWDNYKSNGDVVTIDQLQPLLLQVTTSLNDNDLDNHKIGQFLLSQHKWVEDHIENPIHENSFLLAGVQSITFSAVIALVLWLCNSIFNNSWNVLIIGFHNLEQVLYEFAGLFANPNAYIKGNTTLKLEPESKRKNNSNVVKFSTTKTVGWSKYALRVETRICQDGAIPDRKDLKKYKVIIILIDTLEVNDLNDNNSVSSILKVHDLTNNIVNKVILFGNVEQLHEVQAGITSGRSDQLMYIPNESWYGRFHPASVNAVIDECIKKPTKRGNYFSWGNNEESKTC